MSLRSSFLAQRSAYRAAHRSVGCRLTHIIGIPLIAAALPAMFISPWLALQLFVAGCALQIIGHRIFEKNNPVLSAQPFNPFVYLCALVFVAEELWHFITTGKFLALALTTAVLGSLLLQQSALSVVPPPVTIDQTIQQFQAQVEQLLSATKHGDKVSAADFDAVFGAAPAADLNAATAQLVQRDQDCITIDFAYPHDRLLSGLHVKFATKVAFRAVRRGSTLLLKDISGITVSRTGLLFNPLQSLVLSADRHGNTVIDAGVKFLGVISKTVRIIVSSAGKQI